MAAQQLSPESLQRLIRAVEKYQEELESNRQILLNAAYVCDAAMGSDAIVQKNIGRLMTALEELQKASQQAEEAALDLREDYRRAMDAYET